MESKSPQATEVTAGPYRSRELLGLIAMAFGALLFLSLLTYHPNDPCFNVAGTRPVRNAVGPFGAYLSDLFLQTFGLGGYLIAVLSLFFAFMNLLHRRLRLNKLEFIGYLGMGLLGAALFHLLLGRIEPHGYSAGGFLGSYLARLFLQTTGRVGAFILLGTALLVVTFWTTRFSLRDYARRNWKRFSPRLERFLGRLRETGMDWRDGWTRRWSSWKERRRRQKLRSLSHEACALTHRTELPQLDLDQVWFDDDDDWSMGENPPPPDEPELPQLTPPELEAVSLEALRSSPPALPPREEKRASGPSCATPSPPHSPQASPQPSPPPQPRQKQPQVSPPAPEQPRQPKGERKKRAEADKAKPPISSPAQNQPPPSSQQHPPTPSPGPLAQGQGPPEEKTLNERTHQLNSLSRAGTLPYLSGVSSEEAELEIEATLQEEPLSPPVSRLETQPACPSVHDGVTQPKTNGFPTEPQKAPVSSAEPQEAFSSSGQRVTADFAVTCIDTNPPANEDAFHEEQLLQQALAQSIAAEKLTQAGPSSQAGPSPAVLTSWQNDASPPTSPANQNDPVQIAPRATSSDRATTPGKQQRDSWYMPAGTDTVPASPSENAASWAPSPQSAASWAPSPEDAGSWSPSVVDATPGGSSPEDAASWSSFSPSTSDAASSSAASFPSQTFPEPESRAASHNTSPYLDAPSATPDEVLSWNSPNPALATIPQEPIYRDHTPQEPIPQEHTLEAPPTEDRALPEQQPPPIPQENPPESTPAAAFESHSAPQASPTSQEAPPLSVPQEKPHTQNSVEVYSSHSLEQNLESSVEEDSSEICIVEDIEESIVEESPEQESNEDSLEENRENSVEAEPSEEVSLYEDEEESAEESLQESLQENSKDRSEGSHEARLQESYEDGKATPQESSEDSEASLQKSHPEISQDEDNSEISQDRDSSEISQDRDSSEISQDEDNSEAQDEDNSEAQDDQEGRLRDQQGRFVRQEEAVSSGATSSAASASGPSSSGERVICQRQESSPPVLEIEPGQPLWKTEGYTPPALDLLDYEEQTNEELTPEILLENAELLERTLETYGVRGEVKEIHPGPVITQYEYLPAPGIKVSKIAALSDDLAMALHAYQVRIIAPIPGKGVVGIEVPNKKREMVYLREILAHPRFCETKAKLPVAVGKDTMGDSYVANLAKMPHLLIAGTTGSGKSVGVNAMIISLLYHASPEDVRFLMVDPKMLELSIYEGIPHLLLPVVTDPKKAAMALQWAVNEMERRYALMAEAGVRNIINYNKLIARRVATRDARRRHEEALDEQHHDPNDELLHDVDWEEDSAELELDDLLLSDPPESYYEKLPYIVVVIDELADLMMVAAREVEASIARLAQMARAAGLHLMLATQRPSVDVITGVIKANFPSRIAFQLKSKVDSRTILDQMGAERLLGAGDMLLLPPTSNAPVRVHGAYVSEEEIHRIVKHLKQQGSPDYREEILEGGSGSGGDEEEEEVDEMYDQAVAIVTKTRNASISSLQRKLRIGYNRAARLIEEMEHQGIVGAQLGNKPREVLAQDIPDE